MDKLTIESIKSQTDILDTISQVVRLKRVGSKYIGLCPFHNEKTPSFCVTPSKGIFKCFGCGKVGDVLTFIKDLNGLTFTETLKSLSNQTSDGEAWRQSDAYKKPLHPSVFTDLEPSYFDEMTAKKTFQHYNANNFTQFLAVTIGNDAAILNDLITRFSIGTAKNGFTIFWQRDINENLRTGQIMIYNSTTGKRNRDVNPDWTHDILKRRKVLDPNFNMVQCFFGESQLSNDSKPVAIVEAAKTAAIMTPIEPRYTWIATGGKDGLTEKKAEVLKGKHVVLYPDLGKFGEWSLIAEKLKKRLNLDITVSNLLEKYVLTLPENEAAKDLKEGLDIADYALKFDWFNQAKEPKPKTGPLSIDEQILQNMVKKQPLIKDFINCLGLVNAKTIRPFQSI
jgi:hypothetical protein